MNRGFTARLKQSPGRIKNEVKDYNKWKDTFDLSLPIRKMFGERSSYIFRDMDNPNNVSVLVEWKDIEKASEYAESEDLRASMRAAGVIGARKIYLLDSEIDS